LNFKLSLSVTKNSCTYYRDIFLNKYLQQFSKKFGNF
jgi:hypothetical protein